MSREVPSIPNSRTQLLPLLKHEFKKDGFISKEAMSAVAERTGLPLNEVYGVTTFYSYLPVSKKSKNVIRVCRCLPCALKGALGIIESIQKELDIAPGEATADGKFSFELINCIGACDQAPAIMINDQLFGNLTPDRITEILKSY